MLTSHPPHPSLPDPFPHDFVCKLGVLEGRMQNANISRSQNEGRAGTARYPCLPIKRTTEFLHIRGKQSNIYQQSHSTDNLAAVTNL